MSSVEEEIREAIRLLGERHPQVTDLLSGETVVEELSEDDLPGIDEIVATLMDFADLMRGSVLRLAVEVDRLKAGHDDASR